MSSLTPSALQLAAFFERLAPTLLDIAARSLLILALACLATLAMRRASAAARHWIWLLAIAGLLLLPILSTALPGWNILPRLTPPTSPPPSLTVISPPDASAAPIAEAPLQAPIEPPQTLAKTDSPNTPKPDPTAATPSPAATAQPVPPISAAPPATPTQLPTTSYQLPLPLLPWTTWLVLLYLLGTLLLLTHICLGYLSLWSLQRRSTPITSGDWPDLLRRLRALLNIHHPVQLLRSTHRTMPMTWGLWRARLLLPEESATWPPEQRQAVLLHELGHVRRHDCVAQLLAQIACALYWFNPLVWIAWRRMQLERERACDDLVLNTGGKASTYAEHLLHSASGALPIPRFVGPAIAMARLSTLEERLHAILDPHRNRRTLNTTAALATFLLLLAALVPVATLKAQQTPAPEPAAVPLPPGYANGVPLPPGYTNGTPPTPPGYATGVPLPSGYIPQDIPPVTPVTAATNPVDPVSPPVPIQGARSRGGAAGFSGVGDVGALPGAGRGGGGGRGGGRGLGGPATVTLGEGPTCPLDATIYDLRLPADQIGRLDIDALKRASATPADFEKALAALGTLQPLYRANQTVRLARDTIMINAQTPYITNSQITATGQTINSVAYNQIGFILDLIGKPGAAGAIDLNMQIQVSTLNQTATPISAKVNAPMFRVSTLTHRGAAQPRQPIVLMNVDAASADADGKAVAYIARITFGDLR